MHFSKIVLTNCFAVAWIQMIALPLYAPNGRHPAHRKMGEPHAAPIDLHLSPTREAPRDIGNDRGRIENTGQ